MREVVKDQRTGHIRTPAGKLSQQAGDVAMTAFASTLADGARSIEHTSTARPKSEPASAKADMLASQIPDSQEKIARSEETACEDAEHSAKATTKQASSGTAPETIVGAMETMLLQEAVKSKAAGLTHHTVSENDSAGLSRPHRIVKQRMPAVFPLLMGLVLLMGIGVTGWLTWLAWDKHLVAGTVAADSAESAVPSTAINVKNPAEQREAERLERERQDAEKRLAKQREVERLERERQEAEKRLAELRKAERLERERQDAEKRLAEQRDAERLKRKQREVAKQLALEREAALEVKRAAELEAKRAAALAAWKKASSGIGWAEEIEDDEGESE